MEFDFTKIDVVDFLSELGVQNVRQKGSEVSYDCPFGMHRSGGAASMEIGSTKYHCFGCGAKGNAVTFLSDIEDITPLKARYLLRERYGIGIRDTDNFSNEINVRLDRMENRKKEKRVEKYNETLSLDELREREVDWDAVWDAWTKNPSSAYPLSYMFERGFLPETLNFFKIGWDEVDSRITIPIFDEENNLIGFKGRAADDRKTKYRILGGPEYGFEPYKTDKVLFNLYNAAIESEHIIATEGELNAMMLHQRGYKNSIGVAGRNFSEHHRDLLVSVARSVCFMFDDQKDAVAAAKLTEPFIKTLIISKHDKDVVEMTRSELEVVLAHYEPSFCYNGE